MKKAVFFDLDGTLWDAINPLIDCYNLTIKKFGKNYVYNYDTVKSIMGLTPEESCPILFPNESLEEGIKIFTEFVKDEVEYLKNHPGKLYDGVKETLEELRKKYSLYIVSNADKGYVENFISSLKLEGYFDSFIQAGDTGYPKWKNILYLKEREKVDDLVYVGDTNKDRVETELAKEKFIHAAYGFGKIDVDCNRINTIRELPNMVDKLLG